MSKIFETRKIPKYAGKISDLVEPTHWLIRMETAAHQFLEPGFWNVHFLGAVRHTSKMVNSNSYTDHCI